VDAVARGLAMIFGGIGFGRRKKKVAAANDNGERCE